MMYVDRDCCGTSTFNRHCSRWEDIQVRLDIWHFMRRLSAGCTTDSHQLYGVFMSRLSSTIFEWSVEDMELLKAAKRGEMKAKHILHPTDSDLLNNISRKELSLHCRRTTRGVEETTKLISSLIDTFCGNQGRDTLGVPLMDEERMREIWKSQMKHVQCIQDPSGIQLYTHTGYLMKGGLRLPTYRCARGSTSLENFHLHLNTFIPGQSASDLNFQAYLLEGLRRWNEDRADVARSDGRALPPTHTYSGLLRHAANELGSSVYGKPIDEAYQRPRKYTGEAIGIEYLYAQTGKVLQDYSDELEIEGDEEVDEGFSETNVTEEDPTVHLETEVVTRPQTMGPSHRKPTSGQQESTLRTNPKPVLEIPSSASYEALITDFVSPESNYNVTPSIRSVGSPQPRSPSPSQRISPVASPRTQSPPYRINPMLSPQRSPVSTKSPSPHSIGSPRPSTSPRHTSPTAVSHMSTQSSSDASQSDDGIVSDDSDDSVGPDNVPGYEKVQKLADVLVSLILETSISNYKALIIIRRWKQMDEYDRLPITFSPRYKERLTGRFKAKATSVSPGVESTRRCFLGQNTGPAQWPDCCRYVEAVVIRLCEKFPGNVKIGRGTMLRWTLVARNYNKIRQLVTENKKIMSETNIQLPEINNTTLIQWFNKRSKRLEKEVLKQGITLPDPPMTANVALPPAVSGVSPSSQTSSAEAHVFNLPESTAGMAKTRRSSSQKQAQPPTVCPREMPNIYIRKADGTFQQITMPTVSIPSSQMAEMQTPLVKEQPTVSIVTLDEPVLPPLPPPPTAVSPSVPYSTQMYRKRIEKQKDETYRRREYKRKTSVIKCGKCKEDRSGLSHTLYFGNVYCEKMETVSLEAWKAVMQLKYKKKKTTAMSSPPPSPSPPSSPPS